MPQSSFLPKDISNINLIPTHRIDLIPDLLQLSRTDLGIPKSNVRGGTKVALSDYEDSYEDNVYSQKIPKYLDDKIITSYNAFADTLSMSKIKRLYSDDFRLHDIALKHSNELSR